MRTPSGDTPEADTTRVRQTIEAIAQALERADLASLDTISDDSIRVIVGQENEAAMRTNGWQAYRDHLEGRLGRVDGVQIELDDIRVRLAGRSTALATCRFTVRQGEETVAHGFGTGVLRRAGDNWRLEHVHVSSSRIVLTVEQGTS